MEMVKPPRNLSSRLALQMAPDVAQVHASRGLALSHSARKEEAEEAFKRAIELKALHREGKAGEPFKNKVLGMIFEKSSCMIPISSFSCWFSALARRSMDHPARDVSGSAHACPCAHRNRSFAKNRANPSLPAPGAGRATGA